MNDSSVVGPVLTATMILKLLNKDVEIEFKDGSFRVGLLTNVESFDIGITSPLGYVTGSLLKSIELDHESLFTWDLSQIKGVKLYAS